MRDQFEWESEAQEAQEFEFGSELGEQSTESPFNEAEEMELAAELLGVSSESELEQFLGGLLSKVGRAAGQFIRSPVGQALGGILKGAAKKALPIVGTVLGTAIGGPAGGALGGKLASTAGQIFGLELEGLSGEDQEFEVARRFVRFAGTAANRAAAAPSQGSPEDVAKAAAADAARRWAPGLLRGGAHRPAYGAPANGGVATHGRGGRWVRRGRQIIIFNC